MAVTPQAEVQVEFEDRDPNVIGSGTPFDTAHMMPNFTELFTKLNEHTHTEYGIKGEIAVGDLNFDVATQVELDAETAARIAALAAHEADTTNIHGIADTAALVLTSDARLSDKRISPDNSITSAQIIDGSIQLGDLGFDIATQPELDAESVARVNADNAEIAARQAADALLAVFDGTYALVGTAAFRTRVVGDTTPRFEIAADGTLHWGTGAAGFSAANLYRSGGLKTDGAFFAGGNVVLSGTQSAFVAESADVATRGILFAKLGTDAVDRLKVDASGTISWGGGALAADANLYRSSAANLKTDNSFTAGVALSAGSAVNITGSGSFLARAQASAGTTTLATRLSTDTVDRLVIGADGKMSWSSGAAAADTNLYRTGAGLLQTDSQFTAARVFVNVNGTVTNSSFNAKLTTDTAQRFQILADGKHQWADGTNPVDTNLYRSAANVLSTDDLFSASTLGISTRVKVGAPIDTDWAAAPPDGTIVVDSSANKIWVRVGGVWKSVALV